MRVHVEVKGVGEAVIRAEAERAFRRPLRKMLRAAGNVLKKQYVSLARPVSRKLARRVRVTVDRSPVPEYARVAASAAWVHVAEVGRRPGAKLPPATALRGGYGAAFVVAVVGLPGHHIMQRAVAAAQPDINNTIRTMSREMEAQFNGGRNA